jgi:DNA-binding IclR family transcriptional regulator
MRIFGFLSLASLGMQSRHRANHKQFFDQKHLRENMTRRRNVDKALYLVPAVDRALNILFLLRDRNSDMSTIEIADEIGLNRSTVHKLALTLHHHGILERNSVTKRYSLGIALVSFGQTVLKNLDIRRAAEPYLRELVEYAKETSVLSILRGTKVVIADAIEPKNPHRIVPIIGEITPATATSNGKAILAWLPEHQVNRAIQTEGFPALSKKSITDPEDFAAELSAIRKRGYATDIEEFHKGLCAVSAPLFNSELQAIGTLSVIGPAYRMNERDLLRVGKKCVELAGRLSKKLP